ncbi:hypothetical protein PsYK624_078650 [Phanerochaete sordida]|uniref:Uncharacterized protein n=1 Tax=Phanerochaete sordida TaxID=48140 RepID=A0A9P3GBP9_9APHY|nr:hypothetical protein PsYK624_078650 [Phanerochaete sordida]
MEHSASYQAIFFPADDRLPHLVTLTATRLRTEPNSGAPYRCGHMPHPEVFMEHLADARGAPAWSYTAIDRLEGMSQPLARPYVLFAPAAARDGQPFPRNTYVRDVQGAFYEDDRAWRGNIVVAKYADLQFSAMVDASMADFPIVKNWLTTHRAE